MIIGGSISQVVDFAHEVLLELLPGSYKFRRGDREMREHTAWGYRGIAITTTSHGEPSSVTLSPRLRHDKVEDFVNRYRHWNHALMSDRQIQQIKKTGCTWAVYSAAARGEQQSVELPNDAAWVRARLHHLGELAIARLQHLSDPSQLLEEVRGYDIEREIALLHILGRSEEGRARCEQLSNATEAEARPDLIQFARDCRSEFDITSTTA